MKQKNNSDSARSLSLSNTLQRTTQWAVTHCLRLMGNGMLFAIGFFGTTILAVAVSGTIKTWTTGEVLKSSDLNATISSLKTAIEGITSSQWLTGSNNIYYSGNVGIRTTSNTGTFSIKDTFPGAGGSSSNPFRIYDSNNNLRVSFDLNSTESDLVLYNGSGTARIDLSGSNSLASYFLSGLSIGTSTSTQLLTVNGNAGNTTGVWVNNSDERLKKNIQPLGNFLEKLTELRPVTFEWKDPKKLNAKEGKHIGFIAQEVEKVFPYWVDTDKNGMKWLSMEGVNAAFVQSFKEVALRLRSGSDSIRQVSERVGTMSDSVSVVIQKIESLEKEKAVNNNKISSLEEDNKRLRERLSKLENNLQELIAMQKLNRETMAAVPNKK